MQNLHIAYISNSYRCNMAKNIDIPNGWEVKKLGEVAENGLVNGIFNDPKKIGSGKKLINVIDLYSERAIDTNKLSLLNVTEKEYNTYKVKQFDLFFTRSSLKLEGIAWSNILLSNDTDIIFDCHIMKLTCNTKLINPLYLFYYTRNELARKYLMSVAKLSSMTTISQQDVLNMPIPIPPLAEQEKIAEILSLWDKAIEQTKELIAYKEKQKKGLMQNLLTGKKRLHGFTDKWKTVKLGEVADFISGYSFSSDDFIDKGIALIKISNIQDDNINIDNNTAYLPMEFKDKYNKFIIKTNDLLIAMSGATTGKMGVFKQENIALLNQRVGIIRAKENYSQKFLIYILKIYSNKILEMAYGGAQPNISSNDIYKIKISIPSSLDEQKAIADILCKADKEIELLKKQLDLYTEQKKGLMQNLLTGKVRV